MHGSDHLRLGGPWLPLALLTTAACTGMIGDRDGTEGGGGNDIPVPEEAQLASVSGLRRLTANEYDNTLADLLGDDTRPGRALLPKEGRTPFDNDYLEQMASQALIEAAEKLAGEAAERLLADPTRRDQVVGCTPTGPGDEACFRSFVARFGRLALRRSLTAEETQGYLDLLPIGVEGNDFYLAAETAIRAFLQEVFFLYRVELGESAGDGLYRLSGTEMASRLSYLLWGSMPDAALLDRAEGGELQSPEGVRNAAASMLEDPRARSRMARFHAMWLGYETLKHEPALADAMQAESKALIDRIVFDEHAAWQELLRAEETWADPTLAAHYDLEAPASGQAEWVSYGDSGRQGLLSHGGFLSNGAKFSDTSPTMRGIAIRTRLFCQTIPPPPPGVITDEPPPETSSPCKQDRYAVHAAPGCVGCHALTDGVGFGLENYDQQGRFRTHDEGLEECAIEGKGTIEGVGDFQGPAGLADLALESGLINACVVTQLYRFAVGRSKLDPVDEEFVSLMADKLGQGEFQLTDLVLDYVANPAFGFRRAEQE